jgi:hypothetical protein
MLARDVAGLGDGDKVGAVHETPSDCILSDDMNWWRALRALRKRLAWLLGSAILALSVPAAAYRPFDSTDADVAKPMEFEIEMGPVGYLRAGGTNWLVVPNLVLNLGFTPGWEAVLQGEQLIQLGPTAGQSRYALEDTQLLLKGVLREGCLQNKNGPSIAVEGGFLLPTLNASPKNSSSGFGGIATFIVSWRADWLTVSLDATVLGTSAGELGWAGGAILEGPYYWPVRPVTEVVVGQETTEGTTASVLLGAIWNVTANFSLDAAVRFGEVGGQALAEIRTGFTWNFPL